MAAHATRSPVPSNPVSFITAVQGLSSAGPAVVVSRCTTAGCLTTDSMHMQECCSLALDVCRLLLPFSSMAAIAERRTICTLPLHRSQQRVDVLQARAPPPWKVLCSMRQEGQLAQGAPAEALCRLCHLQQAAAAGSREQATQGWLSLDVCRLCGTASTYEAG